MGCEQRGEAAKLDADLSAMETILLRGPYTVDIDTEDDWALGEAKVRALRKYGIPFVDPDKTHPHLRKDDNRPLVPTESTQSPIHSSSDKVAAALHGLGTDKVGASSGTRSQQESVEKPRGAVDDKEIKPRPGQRFEQGQPQERAVGELEYQPDRRGVQEESEVSGADVRSTRRLRQVARGRFGKPSSPEEVSREGRSTLRRSGLERRADNLMHQRLEISQSQVLPHPQPPILEEEVAWAYETITNKIRGVFLLSPSRAAVLRSYTRDSTGPHLDVGSLHGGSAALVGLTNPRKFIYTIDYYNGYYGNGESGIGGTSWVEPRPDVTWSNFRSICPWRSEYLIVLDCRSDDPPLLPAERFDTSFLDAAAEDPDVISEFNAVAPKVDKYIIIDDVDARWPDKEWVFWMHSLTHGFEPIAHYIDEEGKGIGVLERLG